MLYKLLVLTLIFSSCALVTTRPKQEMSYAQAALLAAKAVKAEIHASQDFRKAENYYLKAKSSYKSKYFNKAKEYAKLSQKFSERAEFQTIKKLSLEGN
ncbi:MAG: hypothetical protein QF441_13630 [Bacteriovoracaceae bacterium]|jgi:CHASE1-domain containing sensor protein|nr:hypothetical protein [Halobacteriovoraceae bacterium]MDP7321647.1 hypothetical protein [Bacteriovoracaceae bacterium]|tara:strand:+ start:253 stop:549 length:297 start_codon:yes stop_codon:yes gene_type:complete